MIKNNKYHSYWDVSTLVTYPIFNILSYFLNVSNLFLVFYTTLSYFETFLWRVL